MSCVVSSAFSLSPSLSVPVSSVRKRTSSFSTPSPKPSKVARTSTPAPARPLRRTISYAVIPDVCPDDTLYTSDVPLKLTSTRTLESSQPVINKTIRSDKEQPERKRSLTRTYSEHNLALNSSTSALQSTTFPSSTMPSHPPVSKAPAPAPATVAPPSQRTTSPLSPHPQATTSATPPRLSPRRQRGKREPDLYRVAILTRMRCSPEGQKILLMGPRLAVSILSATRELERMVAIERDRDGDVVMKQEGQGIREVSLSSSPLDQDWEMVDCGA
ncbi:hypothetical protein OE88DRAFT_1053737 [Heliocybe sulcata]|uniref:Uncharacterized protein n=1 Tax=Heliocybe sulcata TaxID=5364 RepID=A0A5C3ML30_9AGAM|nr:hypothetical protein OE88DRAFT_1053737 [Heliocybe sulcata]